MNFEMSSQQQKNGQRHIVASLYKLQPPESVIDGVGTLYNGNGLTMLEEYASKQLDSITDMDIKVAFLDDNRTMISDHGDTGFDGDMPLYEDAVVVGHFTRGYIDNVEIDGKTERCVIGEGYINESCYPELVKGIEKSIQDGENPNGSIEICKTAGNTGIVYLSGWKPKGRVAVEFEHSGWAIVMNPADKASIILEVNSKEDADSMDEKAIKELIKSTVAEVSEINANCRKEIESMEATIAEKNEAIRSKDSQIAELQTTIDALKAEKAEMETKNEELCSQIEQNSEEFEQTKKTLAEMQSQQRIADMDKQLEKFSQKEQDYAKAEINSFKEAPLEGDIDAIISKICVGIVNNRESVKSENNSMSLGSDDASFGDIFDDNDDVADSNIF